MVCNSRQYISNNVCADVDPSCGTFDYNGRCLTCSSWQYKFYYGTCVFNYDAQQPCGVRQWTASDGRCYDVNFRCNNFDRSNGKCVDCISGYVNNNGVCCESGQSVVYGRCKTIPVYNQNQNNLSSDNCLVRYPAYGCVQCYKYFKLNRDDLGNGYCTPI